MTDNPPMAAKALADYRAGDFAGAADAAGAALQSADANARPMLLVILANASLKLGRRQAAADAFVRAAEILPDKRAEFLKFAANLFFDEGRFEAMAAIAAEVGAANRDDKPLLAKLASALKHAGRLADAAPFIADLDLERPQQFMLLGEFEQALGDPAGFYRFLKDACRARPDNIPLNSVRYARARAICDFAALDEFDAVATGDGPRARAFREYELALIRLTRTDDERAHARPSFDTLVMHRTDPDDIPRNRRQPSAVGEKIRVGYLSNDFFGHATMRLFEEVLLGHDRERFDIRLFCYTGKEAARYQERWPAVLRDEVVSVRDLGDAEAAALIDREGTDILIDLKGFTLGARLGILNRSDAPVKATYLGYPGPLTGMDVDYAITDPIVTPDESRSVYREKLCRLPDTYQSNGSRNRPRPAPVTRAELGLPADRFVFGSFNAVHKITHATLRLWADILRRVPDALLFMLCNDPLARGYIADAFGREGIGQDRLIFFANVAYEAYLGRIAAVHLALDTHPYNGHTTTSDILWAGTPLVTFKGRSFASRVSESLLEAIGLPELVAKDAAGFCDLAAELAGDAARLTTIRERIATNRPTAPLFDTDRFTRHLEHGYEMMMERARAGLPPDHIDVPKLAR
ncbi:O-linked N-acetylglucosamine transferase, SPINDLY family protein [Rhizobium sp. PAMB 3182]